MSDQKSRILEAVTCLGKGERRIAAKLIADELREGAQSGERWSSVHKLASKIGEIDLALEASRRFAFTEPVTLERLLSYCGAMAQVGRSEESIQLLDRLPNAAQNYPAILHFRATIASESGDFAAAEALTRKSLEVGPSSPQGWFALSMIKTFAKGDPDLTAMASIEAQIHKVDVLTQARFYYGMAKALVDVGEVKRGFAYYEKGASLRRKEKPYNQAEQDKFTDALIRDFTPASLAKLTPSKSVNKRVVFVNGLPRSGTTLVESIIVSHSRVSDGAEVNLARPSLLPTLDFSFTGALNYQARSTTSDPWGEIGSDYLKMLNMRFPGNAMVVDKTLSQSAIMGLLLHAVPDAKVIWMRRRPDDNALSAYRAFFTSSVAWSWSWTDIAHQMKSEDRLFAHWKSLFPERILTVPYEELVAAPDQWIHRLLNHVGLDMEPDIRNFHKSRRKIRTASVKQVRSAISTDAIGKSDRFAQQLEPFRNAYYG